MIRRMMRFLSYRGAALAALGAGFSLCGVANCLAQVDHPPGREPGPPAQGQVEPAPPPDRGKVANRLDEIGPLLSKCLQMPPLDPKRTSALIKFGVGRVPFLSAGWPHKISDFHNKIGTSET